MQVSEYSKYDGVSLGLLVKKGEVTPKELYDVAKEAIGFKNQSLNFLSMDLSEWALKDLEIVNERKDNPLRGVPILLKDLIGTIEGIPTQSGVEFTKEFLPKVDSEVVRKYREAGLIIMGKTTVPELGLYPYTETKAFGVTKNPWNMSYSTGGSSGGSAAAVSSLAIPIANASDGGGSIRIPASHCGVFGFKPSRGRVSMWPLVEVWQGMTGQHCITRSVRDSAAMLDIEKTDFRSNETVNEIYYAPHVENYLDVLKNKPPRLKIGVCMENFLGGPVNPIVSRAVWETVKLLESLGHKVEEACPTFSKSQDICRALLVVMAGELAMLKRAYQAGMGYTIKAKDVSIMTWAMMLYGEQISAGEAFWARNFLISQADKMKKFHEEYDILLSPVWPQLPPKIGELQPTEQEIGIMEWILDKLKMTWTIKLNPHMDEISQKNLAWIGFTTMFNMTGQPAMSVPLYVHEGSLPIGSQFVAPFGRDDLLLQLAAELEEARPWVVHDQIPYPYGKDSKGGFLSSLTSKKK